jgi:SMODS and SLOG-associating 2TM effector domain 2
VNAESGHPRLDDFRHAELQGLSWRNPEEIAASLDAVADYSMQHARKAVQWYIDHRKPKRRWGIALRTAGIISLAAAGILPLLTQIFTDEGVPLIAPAWASVALALGIAFVGLDKFFGFSSSWMRYTQTQLRLDALLGAFVLDWQLARLRSEAVLTTPNAARALLGQASNFVKRVDAVVQEETIAWVTEFSEALRELEERMKSQESAIETELEGSASGSVNVAVTNGDQCDGGWTLLIDGAAIDGARRGNSAAVPGLVPGIHRVTITGNTGKEAREAETSFSVQAGEVVSVELTL